MSNIPNLSGSTPPLVQKKLNINPSFEEKFPKLTDGLLITAVALAVISFLVLISFAMVASFGMTMPILAGSLVGSFVLLSVVFAAFMIKNKRVGHQILNTPLSSAIRHALGNTAAAWDNYDQVVKDFARLNLYLHKQEKAVLKHAPGGQEFLGLVSSITENYQMSLEMLCQRRNLYAQLEELPYDNSLFLKNRELMSLCQQITKNVAHYGGVFALKIRGLSPQMNKISWLCNTVILLVGLTAVGAAIAFVPWSMVALPILIATILAAGVCILGISQIIRSVLRRSSTNKKQLLSLLAKNVDLATLKEMTKQQQRLFELFKRSLTVEKLAIHKELESKEKVERLKEEVQRLQDKLAELRFAHRYLVTSMQQREQTLASKITRFDSQPHLDSDDSDDGFVDILKKGASAAQQRRETSANLLVSNYDQHLSEDERAFGGSWLAQAKQILENKRVVEGLSTEDSLLVEEGVSETLKLSQRQLDKLDQLIMSNLQLLSELEDENEDDHQTVVSEVLEVYQALLPESMLLLENLQELFSLLEVLVTNTDSQQDG